MTNNHNTTRDLAWYRSRWDELSDLLSASDPEDVVAEVERLHERAKTLATQHEALAEAGMDDPRQALRMIENMRKQLHELYAEKEAAERVETPGGSTFEQLRAFHAFQEKLQRQLGVSTAENILDMVESLTDQLETFYLHRDPQNGASTVAEQDATPSSASAAHRFREEVGVSDPDAVIAMVKNLTRQLEAVYERQKQLAKQGVESMDHALSMIENMADQLSELYTERDRGDELPSEPTETADEQAVRSPDETESLKERFDRLKAELDTLSRRLDADDPETLVRRIRTLSERLHDASEPPAPRARYAVHPDIDPLVSDAERRRLEALTEAELDALSAGAFCVDDQGTIRRANEGALEWPGVTAESSAALEGRNFFADLAPDTDTPLFRGRFDAGVETEAMDLQFFYGRGDEDSAGVAVHLHRKPDRDANWILFRSR